MSSDKLAQALREVHAQVQHLLADLTRIKVDENGARRFHPIDNMLYSNMIAALERWYIPTRNLLDAHEAEEQAGPVAAEWVGISLSERLDNLMHAARWDKDEVPFLKANLIRDIQRCAPPSESDKEDAELTEEEIKRVHDHCACLPDLVGLKDQWPEVLRFAREVLRAARAKKEQP